MVIGVCAVVAMSLNWMDRLNKIMLYHYRKVEVIGLQTFNLYVNNAMEWAEKEQNVQTTEW
jgi:hypothetical protein